MNEGTGMCTAGRRKQGRSEPYQLPWLSCASCTRLPNCNRTAGSATRNALNFNLSWNVTFTLHLSICDLSFGLENPCRHCILAGYRIRGVLLILGLPLQACESRASLLRPFTLIPFLLYPRS